MLPQSPKTQIPGKLIYLSFRAAWLETLDAIVDQTASIETGRPPGFLEQIPLFAGCAPQIQLELLFETWTALQKERPLEPVQQCVCYCALAELGRVGVLEHQRRLNDLAAGPIPSEMPDPLWLGAQMRTLLITLPVQFQQFEAVLELDRISEGLDDQSQDCELRREILEILGKWHVSNHILAASKNLLTTRERQMLQCLLKSSRIFRPDNLD